MKIVQTILALMALFALVMPCTHAEEHHHHDMQGMELGAADHAQCHTCSDEPCEKPTVAAKVVSVSEIPVRQVFLVSVLKPDVPIQTSVLLPAGELKFLQTVQLLI